MITDKTTLVLGASLNPQRYSYLAVNRLLQTGHRVVAIGSKEGKIENVKIETGFPEFSDIHTVTIYLSVKNQKQFYEYIIALKPKRIIFNPGAENRELNELAVKNNIETMEACTLVLLATGEY